MKGTGAGCSFVLLLVLFTRTTDSTPDSLHGLLILSPPELVDGWSYSAKPFVFYGKDGMTVEGPLVVLGGKELCAPVGKQPDVSGKIVIIGKSWLRESSNGGCPITDSIGSLYERMESRGCLGLLYGGREATSHIWGSLGELHYHLFAMR